MIYSDGDGGSVIRSDGRRYNPAEILRVAELVLDAMEGDPDAIRELTGMVQPFILQAQTEAAGIPSWPLHVSDKKTPTADDELLLREEDE